MSTVVVMQLQIVVMQFEYLNLNHILCILGNLQRASKEFVL